MSLREYLKLKQQIELSAGKCKNNELLLNSLKLLFKNEINSPRRLELITTITQLMDILEIRNVLSREDVSVLKDIAKKLPNKIELLNKINLYEAYYSDLNDDIENCGSQEENITCSPNNISNSKLKRINETITNEIGLFWRDLARNLDIRECEIIDVEFLGNTTAERAKLIMDRYHEISDPQRWFIDLCVALEKARRKDLSRSIQKIMTMNI